VVKKNEVQLIRQWNGMRGMLMGYFSLIMGKMVESGFERKFCVALEKYYPNIVSFRNQKILPRE
jgi:hypothetical protein